MRRASGGEMSALFPPWEAPPAYVPRPPDEGLAQRVSKLAEFVRRNGAQFQELMRQKQQGNPEYGFLFGGEGAGYYRWILYCLVKNLSPDAGPPQGNAAAVPGPPPSAEALAASVPQLKAAEFKQILEGLTGTKDSIKTSQRWFLQNFQHSAGLAAMMTARCRELSDLSKVLHVVYLISDILVHSVQAGATQPQLPSTVKSAFLAVLGEVLGLCFAKSGRSEETKQRLQKISGLWVDRGVYSREELSGAEAAAFASAEVLVPQAAPPQAPPVPAPAPPPMTSAAPWQMAPHPPPPQHGPDYSQQATPQYPASMPPPPMSQPPWGQPHMHPTADPAAVGAPPWAADVPAGGGQMAPQPPMLPLHPGMPPPSGAAPWQQQAPLHSLGQPPMMPPPQGPGGQFGPPAIPSPLPPPVEERPAPVNPMCFPPGILPKLLKGAAADRPYAPLQLDDIQREGLPAANEPDAFLKSRLDKFYAEVHDYHGSKTRSQLLQERGQDPRGMVSSSRGDDLRAEPSAARPMDIDPSTGMRPDGSFAKMGGDRAKGGLGSHKDSESEAGDVYGMYRRERSGVYHRSTVMGRGGSNTARGDR